jgi:putative SOS response-associated peptidase YedK
MCGYLRRHIAPKSLSEFLALLEMPQLEFYFPEDGKPQHFYPAFGGIPEKQIKDLIIRENGQLKTVNATWWYECKAMGDTLRVNLGKQTLNARNLHLDCWREPIHYRRGIALATGIGEATERNGKKQQFYVEGEVPLLLGCVYQKFPNGLYSCAVITRNAHPRFKSYHDDAFPLMLPHDPAFLNLWLSDTPETHPAIAALLDQPKIFTNLTVTLVKTYKDAVPLGAPTVVPPDEWVITA